ncbi:MAG: DUF4139 domain-containing protein [Chloroflexota bacterium]
MRKIILMLGVLTTVMIALVLAFSPVTEAQDTSNSAVSDGVSLTIYNQGTALVQDRRTFDLAKGETTLDFTDVAASIDATSVSFKSLTDPLGTSVLEQNYVYDLVGSSALLERYLDQKVEIVTNDGTTFSGQLLSGRNGEVILRADDGQVTVVSQANIRDIRFPALPEGLITRPTLRWLLQSATSGKQQVELTYLTGGMTWTSDYTILLDKDNTKLDLNGWVTLSNTSGASFQDAQVKLVAGDVNRLPQPQELMFAQGQQIIAESTEAPPPVAQRDFFEYQLYEINRRVTVADNETKQVEFVTGANVPAHTFFVYDASTPFYGYGYPLTDQYYGQSGVTDVQNWLEFSTDKDKGLGADLPAGRIRVYQEDTDGAALLIGENSIDHTPKGEDVKLYLGNAFDLVGGHTQTNYQLIASNVLEETYEIKLRNRKDAETVQIRVPEHLFRWSNWEILNASTDYTKIDSNTIEFRVDVAPGEEKVITYTVRYTWPQ